MSELGEKFIAAAREHYSSLGRQSIEIPEIVVDDKPMVIYWQPLTVLDRETILKKSGGANAGGANLDFMIETIILKAQDEHGNQLFTLANKPEFKRGILGQIVTRVAAEILKDVAIDIGEAEKK